MVAAITSMFDFSLRSFFFMPISTIALDAILELYLSSTGMTGIAGNKFFSLLMQC